MAGENADSKRLESIYAKTIVIVIICLTGVSEITVPNCHNILKSLHLSLFWL
jgi:hypothetical protein